MQSGTNMEQMLVDKLTSLAAAGRSVLKFFKLVLPLLSNTFPSLSSSSVSSIAAPSTWHSPAPPSPNHPLFSPIRCDSQACHSTVLLHYSSITPPVDRPSFPESPRWHNWIWDKIFRCYPWSLKISPKRAAKANNPIHLNKMWNRPPFLSNMARKQLESKKNIMKALIFSITWVIKQ